MLIRAEDIHKSFGKLHVLKGINISINAGEIVSIVGASGAGKTTLLQILGTLLKPDKGKVYIDDIDIYELDDKPLSVIRNKKIGFVFQYHHLLPEFTAIENVLLPALVRSKMNKELKTKAFELLAFVGLADRINHKPSELSGGENQRVAFARALINSPEIVFADEPTGNLDSKTAKELFQLIFKLRERFNTTFVIVTHNEQLSKNSDRILHIVDGKILEN